MVTSLVKGARRTWALPLNTCNRPVSFKANLRIKHCLRVLWIILRDLISLRLQSPLTGTMSRQSSATSIEIVPPPGSRDDEIFNDCLIGRESYLGRFRRHRDREIDEPDTCIAQDWQYLQAEANRVCPQLMPLLPRLQ
jgi:hypothetical protein